MPIDQCIYVKTSPIRPPTWTQAVLICASHLGIQGRPALDEDGRSTYITRDGRRRSAIGWLLSAEQARVADRRGLSPSSIEVTKWVLGPDADHDDQLFLEALSHCEYAAIGEPDYFRVFFVELLRLFLVRSVD